MEMDETKFISSISIDETKHYKKIFDAKSFWFVYEFIKCYQTSLATSQFAGALI